MHRFIGVLVILAVASSPTALVPTASPIRPPSPRTAIFFYGWWGSLARDGSYRHWQQYGHHPPGDIASDYYPARGAYSSSGAVVLDAQMREIRAADVDEVVVSWWGKGSFEDMRLAGVLRVARRHGLTAAIHLEPYPGRTAETVEVDLRYLAGRGIRDVYAYQPTGISAVDWAGLHERVKNVRLFAQTGKVGFAAAGGFDGVYTYDLLAYGGATFARICAEAHGRGLLCAPSVGPGYRANRAGPDRRVKPRRAGLTYDAMWEAAVRSKADAVTITSYNEWHEGTQLEPARPRSAYSDYGGAYGLRGPRAECAYLWRTAQWARAFAAHRSIFGRPLLAPRPARPGCT